MLTGNSQNSQRHILLDAIESHRPGIASLIRENSCTSLREYAARLFTTEPRASVSQPALRVVQHHAASIYGSEVAAGVVVQLATHPIVNSGEHMCLMFQSRRFQSNLLAALGAAANGLRYLPVFACSTIPFTNSSYPRGIIWENEKISMVSDRYARRAVFAGPTFQRPAFECLAERTRILVGVRQVLTANPHLARHLRGPSFERFASLLRSTLRTRHTIALERFLRSENLSDDSVSSCLSEVPRAILIGRDFGDEVRRHFLDIIPQQVFQQTCFMDQLAILNSVLWDSVFSRFPDFPRLVYLPMELITTDLLIEGLRSGRNWAQKMLLEPEGRHLALELFEGIGGAWTENRGTHFFWGIDSDGRLAPLHVTGTRLSGNDVSVELTSDCLVRALSERRIVPGILLNMLVLHDGGFRCLGGINQVEYVPAMHDRFNSFIGEVCSRSSLPMFLCGLTFFFVRNRITGKVVAGSLDTFLREPDRSMGEAEARSRSMSFAQAVLLGFSELYHSIVPIESRDARLEHIDLKGLSQEVGVGIWR